MKLTNYQKFTKCNLCLKTSKIQLILINCLFILFFSCISVLYYLPLQFVSIFFMHHRFRLLHLHSSRQLAQIMR